MSGNNNTTNFNFNSGQAPFMSEVMKTMVQQPDYRGIGGHPSQNHGGHGEHSQTSIGLGNTTVNFRQSTEK